MVALPPVTWRKAVMAESGWKKLDRFLTTDPRDVGCDEAMAVLHVYAEHAESGQDPARRFPGVAAHLAACEQCAEDLHALLTGIEADQEPDRTLVEREGPRWSLTSGAEHTSDADDMGAQAAAPTVRPTDQRH